MWALALLGSAAALEGRRSLASAELEAGQQRRAEMREESDAWLSSGAYGMVADTRAWMRLRGANESDADVFPSESFEAAFHRLAGTRARLLEGAAPGGPSCAVVSSSGRLALHKHGAEIDAHDAVIRMNSAPAGGAFAEHVGTRTTLRVANTDVAENLTYGKQAVDAPLVLLRDLDGSDVERLYRDGARWKQSDTTLYRLHNRFMTAAGGLLFRSGDVNTGAYAVAAALMVCGKVSLYELVPSSEPKVDACEYHYYESGHKQTPCPTAEAPCWSGLEHHAPCFARDLLPLGAFNAPAGVLTIEGPDLEKWRGEMAAKFEAEKNWGKGVYPHRRRAGTHDWNEAA